MNIEIKSRITGNILFSVEAESLKAALEIAVSQGANLRDANLQGADLQGADLWDANLQGADLQGADLQGAKNAPAIIHGLYWDVYVSADLIRIGCQKHPVESWRHFDDDEINEMDKHALEFWRVWKEPLLAIADAKAKENDDEST